MATYVALLHSIVLTPEKRVVMGDLRLMASALGFRSPRTLASTGNLVFEAEEIGIGPLETQLESAFQSSFGKHIDIIVRRADAWLETTRGNPFPTESERDGSLVALRIMREPLHDTIIADLQRYLTAQERLALVHGDLWACFGGRPSASRLLGALTTKRLGIGTSRNWNTVRGLRELVA